MKLKIIVLLIITLLPDLAYAQSDSNVGFFFSVGYQRPEISKLNQLLNHKGFSKIPTGFLSGDISVFYEVYRSLYQFEVSICDQWEPKSNIDNIQTYFHSNGYTFSYGYNLLNSNKIGLYPIVGAVINTGQLELSKGIEKNADFEQLLNTVDNQLGFIVSNTSFSLGIQFHFYSEEFIMGIKGGYSAPFSKTDEWRVNHNTQLINGVEINPGGLYGRIIIGYKI